MAQLPIAGGMTEAIVDLLEPVDVDVGENELPVPMVRAIDLALEQQHANSAAKRAGELIELGQPQFRSRPLMIAVSLGPIYDGLLAIGCCAFAVPRGLAAIRGPLIGLRLGVTAIRCGLLSVRSRLVAVLDGSISMYGPLTGLHLGVPAIRSDLLVTRLSVGLGPIQSSLVSLRFRSRAIRSILIAIRRGVLTIVGGLSPGPAALISVRLGLVAIGRRCFAFRRGSFAAERGLTAAPPALIERRGLAPGPNPPLAGCHVVCVVRSLGS